MADVKLNPSEPAQRPKYRWPWYVLGAFVLAVLLAVLWMSSEVARMKRIRELNSPPAQTGQVPTPPSQAATVVPEKASEPGEMVWIPPGKFFMGSEDGQVDERPVHEIELDGFWIDRTEVTNERFDEFVRATKYVTVAEQKPDPKDFPGAPPENLVAGSIVFKPLRLDELNLERKQAGLEPATEIPLDNHFIWWRYVPGANWRHPDGPESDIKGREKFPVVHVSWTDAMAYCKWAGKELPTEAQWEYAARGGLDRAPYVWGKEQSPRGKWLGNIWQGKFPSENSLADGFKGLAPVGSFPPNGYGLYDMAGNAWEWCADWYLPDYYTKCPAKNPPGPDISYDPNEPGIMKRVQRGGSFLCNDSYCSGYRPGARMKSSIDTGLSHSGFRCVKVGPGPAMKS